MENSYGLPCDFLSRLPRLYQLIAAQLRDSDLSGAELFILSYLSQSPVRIAGRNSSLLCEVTATAARATQHGTSRMSAVVIDLHRKRLIDKMDITADERRQFFGAADGGKNKVIVLRAEGATRLAEFSRAMNHLWCSVLSAPASTPLAVAMPATASPPGSRP